MRKLMFGVLAGALVLGACGGAGSGGSGGTPAPAATTGYGAATAGPSKTPYVNPAEDLGY